MNEKGKKKEDENITFESMVGKNNFSNIKFNVYKI